MKLLVCNYLFLSTHTNRKITITLQWQKLCKGHTAEYISLKEKIEYVCRWCFVWQFVLPGPGLNSMSHRHTIPFLPLWFSFSLLLSLQISKICNLWPLIFWYSNWPGLQGKIKTWTYAQMYADPVGRCCLYIVCLSCCKTFCRSPSLYHTDLEQQYWHLNILPKSALI